MSQDYSFKHFTVQFPADHPYVAHVEINRPDKMNAFFEA
jgi:delta(3,5)-delta(2,4)-dienoyl-CoA isomerase